MKSFFLAVTVLFAAAITAFGQYNPNIGVGTLNPTSYFTIWSPDKQGFDVYVEGELKMAIDNNGVVFATKTAAEIEATVWADEYPASMGVVVFVTCSDCGSELSAARGDSKSGVSLLYNSMSGQCLKIQTYQLDPSVDLLTATKKASEVEFDQMLSVMGGIPLDTADIKQVRTITESYSTRRANLVTELNQAPTLLAGLTALINDGHGIMPSGSTQDVTTYAQHDRETRETWTAAQWHSSVANVNPFFRAGGLCEDYTYSGMAMIHDLAPDVSFLTGMSAVYYAGGPVGDDLAEGTGHVYIIVECIWGGDTTHAIIDLMLGAVVVVWDGAEWVPVSYQVAQDMYFQSVDQNDPTIFDRLRVEHVATGGYHIMAQYGATDVAFNGKIVLTGDGSFAVEDIAEVRHHAYSDLPQFQGVRDFLEYELQGPGQIPALYDWDPYYEYMATWGRGYPAEMAQERDPAQAHVFLLGTASSIDQGPTFIQNSSYVQMLRDATEANHQRYGWTFD